MTEEKPTSADANHTIAVNSVVTFHYRMCEVDNDGNKKPWLENSFGHTPVSCLHGHHNVVAGVEDALTGRSKGEKLEITVEPEKGYGVRQDIPVRRVPIKHLYEANKKSFRPGDVVTVQTNQGWRNVTIVKGGKFNVDVDLNHPFAGRTLYYEIEIIDVRPASREELSHGHAHGPGGHHH